MKYELERVGRTDLLVARLRSMAIPIAHGNLCVRPLCKVLMEYPSLQPFSYGIPFIAAIQFVFQYKNTEQERVLKFFCTYK